MADVTFFDLTSSPDCRRIYEYKEHIDVPEDAYAKGCYYENGNWYKDFYIYANSQTISVKTLLAITINPDGGYNITVRSLLAQAPSSDAVQRIAKGFSISIDEGKIDPIVDALKNQLRIDLENGTGGVEELLDKFTDKNGNSITKDTVINTPNSLLDFNVVEFIDITNTKLWDSSLINYFYDFFLKEFGDIGNRYAYQKIKRDSGVYYLVDWDNSVIPSVMGGNIKDGNITLSGYNSDRAYNLFNNILTMEDEDVKSIIKCPVVRTATRFVAPETGTIKISGFTIENNNIEVNNDLMYATVLSAKSINFIVSGDSITKDVVVNRTTGSHTETFKNTIRSEFLDRYGETDTTLAVDNYSNVIDSIGWSGNLKPYTILAPDYPVVNIPPSDRYPDWIDHKPQPPVGDNTPNPDPDPIRIGTPVPYKRVFPIPTPTPGPPPEDESSNVETTENDPPSTKGVLGSMYDLGTDDLLLNQLAAFLYDPLNSERIAQFWKNDPTQSIVSLHYLYVDPTTSGNPSIALGNVNTNINAPEITNRYKTFDCGTRAVERKFNNSMDYSIKVSLYLPFSGIHPLNTEEVMNSKIGVKGTVDVVTGDILYQLTVNRKKLDGTYMTDNKCLYTFTGNCKVDIPYSSATINKGGLGGIVGNVLTGNLKGAFTGAVGTAANGFSDVSSSGNLGGNTGAMGYKYPYLIIEYPKVIDVSQRGKLFGHASNKTVRVSQVSGYAEFERVHVDTLSCTEEDRTAIENILKTGVIL